MIIGAGRMPRRTALAARARARLALLLSMALAHANAAAGLVGDPSFTRLVPDIPVYPQNFAIAQDGDAILYVGNNDGVLTYDGARWEFIKLPNGDLVRSLRFDGGQRVYAGGFDMLGYLERDEAGRVTFEDLTPRFAALLDGEAFGDVWEICITPDGVFFQALRHLFRYEPASGAVDLWRHDGRFGAFAYHGGTLFMQFRGEGMRRFAGGGWQPVAGAAAWKDLVYDFIDLPGGGGQLALAADGRWRVWRDGRVESFPVPDGFPPSSSFSTGTVLSDQTVALASDNGWIYLLDPRAGTARRFRLQSGYLTDILVAADGGILVAADDAVFHVEWPAPWTVIGPGHGLSGTLHAMAHWAGNWYAVTGAGVQRLRDGADGRVAFEPLAWTGAEGWALLEIDAQSALLAESYAVKLIRGDSVQAVTHGAMYPRVLARSAFDRNVVFVGAESGFGVLRKAGTKWRLVVDESKWDNLLVNGVIETEPGVVWLGSDRAGAMRLRLSPDYARLEEALRFGADSGIAYGEIPAASLVRMTDGTLVASTTKGQFRWTQDRFEKIDLDGLDRLRDADERADLMLGPDGSWWAHSYKNIYRHVRGSGWRREEIGSIRLGALEAATFDETGAAVFSTSTAILRYDDRRAGNSGRSPALLLRGVAQLDVSGAPRPLPLRGALPLRVAHGEGGLAFRFAMPDHRRPDAVRYQARLKGIDEEFSGWSTAQTLTYPRLPPGDYAFELRARDSHGRINEIEPFRIAVLPPWYATAWAQLAWAMLALASFAVATMGAVRLRTARLAGDKSRLERMIAERTTALEAANQQLEGMAHVDGLTGVANRRRLDNCLDQVWHAAGQTGATVSLLAIDADHFKDYNDTHGHLAGDELLIRLVRSLGSCLDRNEDLLARYGGDEFMVVLPGMSAPDARMLAERMRAAVEAGSVGITVSIGVATLRPRATGGPVEELLNVADGALYQAKATGRNRVIVA